MMMAKLVVEELRDDVVGLIGLRQFRIDNETVHHPFPYKKARINASLNQVDVRPNDATHFLGARSGYQ
jgi:hypothetical protein